MSRARYISQLLYSKEGALDRVSFLISLMVLSLISLALLLVQFLIASNTDPYSFQTTLPAISFNSLTVITNLHAILVLLNITHKRLAYIECHPLYIIGLFLPYIKILFLGILLLEHKPRTP
tara:strand:- start:202536 stop:202898 length:363 start_codon:yes stop_codon:yes gene_type:complete